MKKTIIALLLSVPITSVAAERFYIGIEGGLSQSMVTKAGLFQDYYIRKNVGLGTLKAGYAFDNGIRTELALTQYGEMNADYESGRGWIRKGAKYTAKSQTVMVNLYGEGQIVKNLSGYAMTGFGIASNELLMNYAGIKVSESLTGFAWQFGGGFSYNFTENLIGDLGIKYTWRNRLEEYLGIDLASVDTTIGIRYMF